MYKEEDLLKLHTQFKTLLNDIEEFTGNKGVIKYAFITSGYIFNGSVESELHEIERDALLLRFK